MTIHDYLAPGLFDPLDIRNEGELFSHWTIQPRDYSAQGRMEWNNDME